MGRLQLNLNHMISFYFVAKERSFSKASRLLAITQPAVTQHIHILEVQFGVKLINIKRKQVFLTKAGERLFVYADEFFNQAMMMENFLKNYRFSNVSIGIASQLVFYFTPLIDKFKELHPATRVSIREGPSRMLVDELLDLKHDICLVGPAPVYNGKVRLCRIARNEPMVFVVAPEYILPSDRPLKLAELTPHPLILQSEGSAARAMILSHFEKKGLKPRIGAEVDNIQCAKELARQKKGVAFMFEPNIREEVARGDLRVVEIEGGEIRAAAIDLLTNKDVVLSPAAEAFLFVLKGRFGESLREIPS